ncbi:MAG: hypothetical protein MZW92_48965 [Comamonadaceae bacterium]|nr:hypothetical protein [Comamonadaceae bacterium]
MHVRPAGSRTRRSPPVWFFDLDNTLHDASHAIFRAIDTRMTSYVERHLAVDRAEADRLRRHYWLRYGATLLGLVRHHGVDPHHFLHETHDFEVADLLRAERGLVRLFARLPGRKVLLTNAPARYATAVVRALALHRQLGARYTIETMRVHGTFRPQALAVDAAPHAGARARAARQCSRWSRTAPPNLRAARAVGFRTVLVGRPRPRRTAPRAAATSACACARCSSCRARRRACAAEAARPAPSAPVSFRPHLRPVHGVVHGVPPRTDPPILRLPLERRSSFTRTLVLNLLFLAVLVAHRRRVAGRGPAAGSSAEHGAGARPRRADRRAAHGRAVERSRWCRRWPTRERETQLRDVLAALDSAARDPKIARPCCCWTTWKAPGWQRCVKSRPPSAASAPVASR